MAIKNELFNRAAEVRDFIGRLDEGDPESVAWWLIKAKLVLDEIEDERVKEMEPVLAVQREINDQYSRMTSDISVYDKELRDMLREIRKREEVVIKIKEGTIVFEEKMDFVITNPEKVDYDLMSPDSKKIKQKVKSGVRKINGCEVFRNYIVYVKPKREVKGDGEED